MKREMKQADENSSFTRLSEKLSQVPQFGKNDEKLGDYKEPKSFEDPDSILEYFLDGLYHPFEPTLENDDYGWLGMIVLLVLDTIGFGFSWVGSRPVLHYFTLFLALFMFAIAMMGEFYAIHKLRNYIYDDEETMAQSASAITSANCYTLIFVFFLTMGDVIFPGAGINGLWILASLVSGLIGSYALLNYKNAKFYDVRDKLVCSVGFTLGSLIVQWIVKDVFFGSMLH